MAIPNDYTERVYAGVLGKIIGVYLGRPFEGWTYERIQQRLGDITDYVHAELGVPLLGRIPLDENIVSGGDQGTPVVRAHPETSAARAFASAAGRIRSV